MKGLGGKAAKIIGTLLKTNTLCQPEMRNYSFFFQRAPQRGPSATKVVCADCAGVPFALVVGLDCMRMTGGVSTQLREGILYALHAFLDDLHGGGEREADKVVGAEGDPRNTGNFRLIEKII